MSREIQYKCDVCKKPKGDVNHWLIAGRSNSVDVAIAFGPWDDLEARREEVIHLCGHECAHKKLDEVLGGLK